MSNQNIIQSTSMPRQEIPAMPPGSKSLMDAGIKMQQQQDANQMALIGKSGGSRYKRRRSRSKKNRRSRRFIMGGSVIQVPPVPTGTPNASATGSNYKGLTELTEQQASQSVFDTAQTPAQTASIAAQQQTGKSGGSRKGKRGGSWPVWGCMSGGSKKRRKNCKCKRNKSKRINRHHH